MEKEYKPLKGPIEISPEDRARLILMVMRADDLSCFAGEVEMEYYKKSLPPSQAEKDYIEDLVQEADIAKHVVFDMVRDIVFGHKLQNEYPSERYVYNIGREDEIWPYWTDKEELEMV